MSILSAAQNSALVGRLLGVPDKPAASNANERIAPTGTVAGTMPSLVASAASNRAVLLIGGIIAVLGVIYLARKVL